MDTSFSFISVIVPVYNGAPYVAEALASILAQAYHPLEIIVVDDGSTDDTAAIVQQFGPPVYYHHQRNQGSSVARNSGVAQAKGDWLAFLDADDLWTPNKLRVQIAVLQENPTVDVVWGHVVQFRGDSPNPQAQAAPIPGYHVGTMLIRTRLFAEIGAFSTTYFQGEMVDWVARLQRSSVQQMMLPDVLMYRRIHQTNKGKSDRYSKREYLHVLQHHLKQKRANP